MINNMQRAEKKYIKIGHTLLSSSISNPRKANALKKYRQKFDAKDWIFDIQNTRETNQWIQILSYIHETSCELMKFKKVSGQRMLMGICHPNYNSLMNLYLIECKIDSIEFLTFLNAEKMISLDLTSNKLACLKALNKLKWKQLTHIYLSDNPVVEFRIYRIKMKPEMSCLKLQEKKSYGAMGEDLNFLLKLPLKNYGKSNNFELDNEGSRVRQDKVVEVIKRKFPKVKIKQTEIPRGFQDYFWRTFAREIRD